MTSPVSAVVPISLTLKKYVLVSSFEVATSMSARVFASSTEIIVLSMTGLVMIPYAATEAAS